MIYINLLVYSALFGLLALVAHHFYRINKVVSEQKNTFVKDWPDRVLIVTAHPDDECMFFAPTLSGLKREEFFVHITCFSSGNADGLGGIRKLELQNSAAILNVDSISVLDRTEFQDGFDNVWDKQAIAKTVRDFVKSLNIGVIITFDSYGVSGHPNHIALYHGVQHYIKTTKNQHVKAYCLKSVSVFSKFTSFLGIPFISQLYNRKDISFINSLEEYTDAKNAMRAHKSQLVWFRRLYILFSRYMFINDLQQIKKDV